MSNFNIDSGSTDNIYEPQPSDSPSGPHGIAETDDTIITDLEASEGGILDLAGRLTVSNWVPNHNYEKLQLAMSPVGAYVPNIQSLIQANAKFTSGATFNPSNWAHVADLFDATPTFSTVTVTNTVNAGGGFVPGNTGNIHGDGKSLYLDGGGFQIFLRPSGVGVDAGMMVGDSTGQWATYDASANVRNILDDGSGNATVSGHTTLGDYIIASSAYLHLRPAPSGFVGFTNNNGNLWGLYVADAATPSTYTAQNTLDDGLGNLTVSGVVSSNSVSTTTPAFHIGAGVSISGWAGNLGVGADTNLSIVINTATNKGLYTAVAGVKSNTLDDGSGNVSITGSGTFGWGSGDGNILLGTSVTSGSASTIRWRGDGSGYSLSLSSIDNNQTTHGGIDIYDNGQVLTLSSTGAPRNTLDDGSGNVTVTGTVTANKITAASGQALVLNGVTAVDINYNNSSTGSLQFFGGGTTSLFSVDNTGNTTVGRLAVNSSKVTVGGSSAGSYTWTQPYNGSSYKKVLVYLNGYENTTATAQTITFSTAFTDTPYLAHDDSGGSTVSTTTLTLPVSMAAAKTGWIVVEGF